MKLAERFDSADYFGTVAVIEQNRSLTAGERFAARLGAEVQLAVSDGLDRAEVNRLLTALVQS